MKVMHLLSSNKFSGAENVVCQIISAFKETDIEFIYVSPDGPIADKLKQLHIRFVPVKYLNILDLKKIVKEEKPDLIHGHDMLASLFATIAVRRIPIISHIHNNNFGFKGIVPFAMAATYRMAAHRAKHIFWVSEAAYQGYRYKKHYKEKSSILHNVIDIEELYKKVKLDNCEYRYDVIFLGRLTFPKNPERVLSVIQKVKENKKDIKVAMVGTGELDEKIRNQIEEMKLQQNIELYGFVENPYKILKNSSIMLMTSRWEGLPMCALEAMALGVPIVSTPTDGLKEVVQEGITGYLREDDAELADKILEILRDEKLRSELSVKAHEQSLQINSIDKYREEIFRVYKECVNDKGYEISAE